MLSGASYPAASLSEVSILLNNCLAQLSLNRRLVVKNFLAQLMVLFAIVVDYRFDRFYPPAICCSGSCLMPNSLTRGDFFRLNAARYFSSS